MNNRTDLLLIFTRNPVLGKCKSRLAADVGKKAALNIYKFLLEHTVTITQNIPVQKQVYYSEEIWENDIWNNTVYQKKLQQGTDLGERMMNAFNQGFKDGFERILVIGSDMFDLDQKDLEFAFNQLNTKDYVLGPATDGGYYLLGMKKEKKSLFQGKNWGKETVLQATIDNLKGKNYALLPQKNDVDYYKDIKNISAFAPFLKHMKQ